MSNPNQFLLYTAPDGAVKVDVYFKGETVWLIQKALAELFAVKRPAITKHLLNIFKTGELAEDSVSSILEHTAEDGKKYATKCYNLDAIISVCCRVAMPCSAAVPGCGLEHRPGACFSTGGETPPELAGEDA
jgi:hypothetical protein